MSSKLFFGLPSFISNFGGYEVDDIGDADDVGEQF